MTLPPAFRSGRIGRGAAYTADRSGSTHTKIIRISAFLLAPLGVLALWFIAEAVGKSFEGVRAEIGRPFPAFVLIAFICVAMYHARMGADNIIDDYVHDEALKTKALAANKWLAVAICALWALSIFIIAASN
jgi:succinate dehydrogenase / fumarate reductase, membrane anchor subunit